MASFACFMHIGELPAVSWKTHLHCIEPLRTCCAHSEGLHACPLSQHSTHILGRQCCTSVATTPRLACVAGMGGAVGMVRNWTYTLFFVLGELWGDVVLSLLFWGLANELTHMSEVSLRTAGAATHLNHNLPCLAIDQAHSSNPLLRLTHPVVLRFR